MSYYQDSIGTLARLFGTDDIEVGDDELRVGATSYPIVHDVIVTLPDHQRPTGRLGRSGGDTTFAADIQETFGREWRRFDHVLPEQRREFDQYFDVVDRGSLSDALVCDFGAGMGRWSSLAAPFCRQMVLVDFSDSIFVARETLRDIPGTVFVMGDITNLPFADDCCDFAMCLGVLHTVPADPIAVVRSMRRYAPRLLVYTMYALDNRPKHFVALLRLVTEVRRRTSRIADDRARKVLVNLISWGVYRPCMVVGGLLRRVGQEHRMPLSQENAGKSMEGIRQVVYDRFFTSIEQRATAAQIDGLRSSFSEVLMSDAQPYWHFLCTR